MSDRVEISAKEVEKFLTIVQENLYVGHCILNAFENITQTFDFDALASECVQLCAKFNARATQNCFLSACQP